MVMQITCFLSNLVYTFFDAVTLQTNLGLVSEETIFKASLHYILIAWVTYLSIYLSIYLIYTWSSYGSQVEVSGLGSPVWVLSLESGVSGPTFLVCHYIYWKGHSDKGVFLQMLRQPRPQSHLFAIRGRRERGPGTLQTHD